MAKAAGKAVAKKKLGGQDLSKWEEELKAAAAEESERTPAGTGNWIKVGRGGFKHQSADLGKEILVVVVDHVFMNTYFDSVYDEDTVKPPACFAVAAKDKNMAPVDDSPDKQSPGCDGCWANEWKSDARQKGKACSNKKGLAVLFADDLEGEVAYLTVGVTSTPTFNKYVKKLDEASNLPSNAVVTKVFYDENAEVQKLLFVMEERLDRETWNKVKARAAEARSQLMTTPDFSGYVAPKASKAAKPASKGGPPPRSAAKGKPAAGRGRLSG